MSYLKQLFTAVACFIIIQDVRAGHLDAWFRGTWSMPVSERIQIDVEGQHRRQNGFGNTNPLDKNLMFSFRNWVHYKYSPNVKISVSPFACFSNYKIIQKQADARDDPGSEIRFAIAADVQQNVMKNAYVAYRAGLEYRFFQGAQKNIWRLRNRFDFRYGLSPRGRLYVFDELLLNAGGAPAAHILDHNRTGVDLEYRIMPDMKLEMGYMHIVRLPFSGNTISHENNFFLNLTYTFNKHKLVREAHPAGC